ncbi:MAG: hypothetical protein FJZ01_18505, partial [Candidatus Sericytochromatia bacterium]|nr:hypothetical protein [Candidatus Tanganyikabacteria bacterium]
EAGGGAASDKRARLVLAEIARRTGDLTAAATHLRDLHALDPTDRHVSADLALALADLGNGEEAVALLRPWRGRHAAGGATAGQDRIEAIWRLLTREFGPAVAVAGTSEGTEAFSRQAFETATRFPLGPATALLFTATRRWQGGTPEISAPDILAGVRQTGRGWRIDALAGFDELGGGLRGSLAGRWQARRDHPLRLEGRIGRERWDSTEAVAAARGWRDGGSVRATWQPPGRISVAARAELFGLTLGVPFGDERAAGVDIEYRLPVSQPLDLGYAFTERAISGPAAALGLQPQTSIHSAGVAWRPRFGAVDVAIRPEVQTDARRGTLGVGVSGGLSWQAGDAATLEARGGVGSAAVETTAADRYHHIHLGLAVRF